MTLAGQWVVLHKQQWILIVHRNISDILGFYQSRFRRIGGNLRIFSPLAAGKEKKHQIDILGGARLSIVQRETATTSFLSELFDERRSILIFSRHKSFSPLTVGEGKDGTVQVATERSEHPSLVEVNKMDFTVHAAGHGCAKVGHESNARNRVRVHRHAVVPS